ncbi:hypothetical protein DFH06DRAFT_324320 [Mycena polygramma]|nr:hypothetical protein DFH06DRAFT_324320 [Mycena polygramma]
MISWVYIPRVYFRMRFLTPSAAAVGLPLTQLSRTDFVRSYVSFYFIAQHAARAMKDTMPSRRFSGSYCIFYSTQTQRIKCTPTEFYPTKTTCTRIYFVLLVRLCRALPSSPKTASSQPTKQSPPRNPILPDPLNPFRPPYSRAKTEGIVPLLLHGGAGENSPDGKGRPSKLKSPFSIACNRRSARMPPWPVSARRARVLRRPCNTCNRRSAGTTPQHTISPVIRR